MSVKFTKSQLRMLVENEFFNYKPAREFDKVYGTNLGQSWDFGNDLTSDDVWDLIQKCHLSDDCQEIFSLVDDLDENIFPYLGVNKLSLSKKMQILSGMASELNFDDIVHFVIKNQNGLTDKNFDKFYKKLTNKQKNDVQWISSPKTLQVIKKHLKK